MCCSMFVKDPQWGHDSTHIMLKAKVPLPGYAYRQAHSRADSLISGSDGDTSSVGRYLQSEPRHPPPNTDYWRHGPPPGPPGPPGHFERGPPPHPNHAWGHRPPWDWGPGQGPGPGHGPPPPPWHQPWRGPKHHGHGKGPHGPPPIYLINTGGGGGSAASVQRLDSLEHLNIANAGRMNLPHNVSCSSCSQSIFGIRWLCANCPTQPTLDLVSSRAYTHSDFPDQLVRSARNAKAWEEPQLTTPCTHGCV